jgi:hypothetical protein
MELAGLVFQNLQRENKVSGYLNSQDALKLFDSGAHSPLGFGASVSQTSATHLVIRIIFPLMQL